MAWVAVNRNGPKQWIVPRSKFETLGNPLRDLGETDEVLDQFRQLDVSVIVSIESVSYSYVTTSSVEIIPVVGDRERRLYY